MANAMSEQMATKADIRDLELKLEAVKTELSMVKGMVDGIGFGVLLLVLKSFWPA